MPIFFRGKHQFLYPGRINRIQVYSSGINYQARVNVPQSGSFARDIENDVMIYSTGLINIINDLIIFRTPHKCSFFLEENINFYIVVE